MTRGVKIIVVGFSLLFLHTFVQAQPFFLLDYFLGGDNMTGDVIVRDENNDSYIVSNTPDGVFASNTNISTVSDESFLYKQVYTPPPGKSVSHVSPKVDTLGIFTLVNRYKALVFLTDGTVVTIDLKHITTTGVVVQVLGKANGSSTWAKAIGDALYALGSSVFVSRDTGKTWQIDTLGFSGVFARDIALDTLQYVYAATTNGLFKQHPDSSVWHKITTLTSPTALATVFIDRTNRIFVAGNGGGFVHSTDNGSTWVTDTTGVGGVTLRSICDDMFGNIYATGGSGTIYESVGGTGPWVRIDAGISAITGNTPAINGLAADSLLVAATNFGVYVTADQGVTWFEENRGIIPGRFYGFVKHNPGRFFISTSLGIFYRDAGDTVWHKSFPASGYLGALPIYEDSAQTLFTVLPNTDPTSVSLGPIYKSTDGGVIWNADTLNLSSTIGRVFFVDERGGEHIGSSYSGFSYYARVYAQDNSGHWILDTSGIPNGNFSSASSFGTDRAGMIYLSGTYVGSPRVLRRPISGGTWVVDTVGLPATVHTFSTMKPGVAGEVFGTNGTSLYRHSSGTWNAVPLPGSMISKFTVDRAGTIFVANSAFLGFTLADIGISMSTDNGSSWVPLTTDTIQVNVLHSHGDTSYALITGGGLYILTKNGIVTSVPSRHESPLPSAYKLDQNYPNPFNPVTIINYQLPVSGFVTLKIYNILGQQVATLVEGMQEPGYKSAIWDGSNMPSGVYFYRLKAGPFSSVRKMLLVK